MKPFTPCRGKTACRDDGVACLTCGRGLQEVEATRRLIDALAELAVQYEYENPAEFVAYVASKVGKKVRHRREGQAGE
ncbi:MAG: hypothetical protein HY850_08145 [Betaproteobacteria bacterium]|nr:hypothetical protein [Betaproteobacteria bacterium]